MVTVKSFSEMMKKDVFTNQGSYCGKIADINIDLEKFRVQSLVVDAVRGSFLAKVVGNKKGIVVPFQLVESIGDIVIIKHVAPTAEIEEEKKEDVEEETTPISF